MTRYASSHGHAGPPRRVRSAYALWIADRLSARDWQIIKTINRLRLVNGRQLERVHFQTLASHSREVARGRVLRRLVQWQVLTVLPRRIGGAPRGSAGSVFTLGPVGARLCREQQAAAGVLPRVRRPELPTERTVRHVLAVSELYADLIEQARTRGAHVLTFEAEPACWWPDDLGGYLKPDAYTLLARQDIRDHWWIEVDLATESLPAIRRKLSTYLDFATSGQLGPGGLVPRILVTASTPARYATLRSLVQHLPAPAAELFIVLPQQSAVAALLRSLNE